MKTTATTAKGGAVQFNKSHGAYASYAVTGIKGLPAPELFYAGIKLPNGKRVQFFVNRETGLVVVDIIDKGGRGGKEIVRYTERQTPKMPPNSETIGVEN